MLLIWGRSGVEKSSIAFELHAQQLVAAMGDEPRVVAVLLTATVETAQARLGRRSAGTDVLEHIKRSNARARELDALTPEWVHRLVTDGRSVIDAATQLRSIIG
ncbi:hypothetical protein ARTHRO9V_280222 [Arthrobacter sp. 9V]|nr:hypothetical protein ARTHRO9V_280222 [Arthrobacter sp. 9V]